MPFRCKDSEFSHDQFERFKNHYWRIPSDWGEPTSALLRDIRRVSQCAPRLLPLIGQASAMRYADAWHMSLEKAARLAGIDPKTCKKVTRGLEELGLVETKTVYHHGVHLTKWRLCPSLAAHSDSPAYFSYSMSLVYGGNWARLTSPQCAVYLAAATRAFTLSRDDERTYLTDGVFHHIDMDDLDACLNAGVRGAAVRVAIVSKAELCRITGYSKRAVDDAVRGLRYHNTNTHSPLCAYDRYGGSLLYHFRDHVEPVPYAVLNDSSRKPDPTSAALADSDDDLPF